ncbi:hypothetical protein [Halorhabdus rudnickae]|uniref:hypothetical protein n=1 Tax=Halorhabdus rudnickae TaxID=1775544 RepID=UPI00108314E5|nr:hypothetical protein [Halorhabdus rudnickae]
MGDDSETIRILHVDDEPDFAEMAATFLEREDDRLKRPQMVGPWFSSLTSSGDDRSGARRPHPAV